MLSENVELPPDISTAEHVTGPGNHRPQIGGRLAVGGGTTKIPTVLEPGDEVPSESAEDELSSEVEYQVKFVRADGTAYDKPPAQNVSEYPLRPINIELDENDEPVWRETAQIEDQYRNRALRKTWREEPTQSRLLDLDKTEDLEFWNELQKRFEPAGAPGALLRGYREIVNEQTGSLRLFVTWKYVRYKNIISLK